MSELDDLFASAIREGAQVLAAKKRKKVEPKETPADRRKLAAKLMTETVGHEVYTVHRGTFEMTCLVAEYVRRTCKHCGFSELCSVPRVFVCEQQVGQPSTRRLHRIHSAETVQGYILAGKPVKTEVFTSPAPFCKHCVKEVIDHAQRPPVEGDNTNPPSHPVELIPGAIHSAPGTVPAEAPAGVQVRSSEPVHDKVDLTGFAPGFLEGTDWLSGYSEGGLPE